MEGQDLIGTTKAADRMADWLCLVLGAASVIGALIARVVHRGLYYPGWDLIAATNGHYLASTRSVWGAVSELWYQNRHFFLPFSAYSAIFAFLPGYLGRPLPWEFWPHLITFVAFLTTLGLLLLASGVWSVRAVGMLLLACGASPALLSYAVEGYPWASGYLPIAVGLVVVLHPRFRRSLVLTALGLALAVEMSWHCYELGKAVGPALLLAALVERGVSRQVRGLWLVAALWQVFDVMWWHRTANVAAFALQRGAPWTPVTVSAVRVVHGFGVILSQVYLTHQIALPIVVTTGLLSLLFFKSHRRLLGLVLLLQIGLVVLLATYSPESLQARRFSLIEYTSLLLVLGLAREAGLWARTGVALLLLVGNGWQWIGLAWTLGQTFPAGHGDFTLPFVESADGVGMVDYDAVRWAREVRFHVEAGERMLLLYNLGCYAENITNPEGVLERLYLGLGHERFVQSIFVFGSVRCRYSCLPVRPLGEFGPFLQTLRQAGVTVYYDSACRGPGTPGREVRHQLAILRRRFTLIPVSGGGRFQRFAVAPAAGRSRSP